MAEAVSNDNQPRFDFAGKYHCIFCDKFFEKDELLMDNRCPKCYHCTVEATADSFSENDREFLTAKEFMQELGIDEQHWFNNMWRSKFLDNITDWVTPIVFTEAHANQHKACSTCQEDFAIGESATTVPCGHIFHESCIVPWVRKQNSCPNCREIVKPILFNKYKRLYDYVRELLSRRHLALFDEREDSELTAPNEHLLRIIRNARTALRRHLLGQIFLAATINRNNDME